MGRSVRICYQNAHYHVFNRGHSKQPIFMAERHYELFLEILRAAKDKFGFEILAYALMKNHYHLQLITPNGNISEIMEYVGRVYALKFNREMGRLGPLWQSRFKSVLVEKEQYLLHLNRYIHLNAFKAGYSSDVLSYKWSSIFDYLGNPKDKLITTDPVMKFFDNTDDFLKFTRSKMNTIFDKNYEKKHCPTIIGSEKFKEKYTQEFNQ